MQSAKILVDTTRAPLIVQRMFCGFGDMDLEHMIRQFELLLDGGQRYSLLVYSDPTTTITARQRKRVSEWYRERGEQVKRSNVGVAVVIESPLVRGAMTAFNWLIEPMIPQRHVANIRDGVDFCIQQLEKSNIAIPAEVFALRDVPERKLKQLA